MSQEKVDKYKQEKANRKKIMKKEKIKHATRKMTISLIAFGLVGWLGYSAYTIYESKKPRPTVEVNYDNINTYLDSLEESDE